MKVGRRSSSVPKFTSIKSSTIVWPPSSSSEGASIIGSIIKSLEDGDCVSADRHSKGASFSKSISYVVITWEKTFK